LSKRILVITDAQVKPGVDTSYVEAIGNYAAEKRPDVIINIGDWWDMPSLSSWDIGKKSFEGRRYINDVAAGNEAMDKLLFPIFYERDRLRINKKKAWNPELHFLLGNHEQRIERAVNGDAKLEGLLGYDDLNLGLWKVHPFLKPVIVDDIAFAHYFITGQAGRPASTAQAQLNKKHMSCIAGHQQGLQIATAFKADGRMITSVIAGSCYTHEEDYLGPQGNRHWRGVLMLNDVHEGEFDLMPVSTKYLLEKYV
jgi:hypothetical protein